MIKFVPAYYDRELFRGMLKDYLNILKRYDNKIRFEEETVDSAKWITDFIERDGEKCGFVCKEEVDFEGKDSLLYIGEFYIAPEYRNMGIGKEAVKTVLEAWRGDIFFYILDGNLDGEAFWNSVGNELGWKCTDRPEVRREPGCQLRIYKTRTENE